MLAAPEFVEAELVEMLRQVEVAAELQHRMFADGMMRGQKSAEADTSHGCSPGRCFSILNLSAGYGSRCSGAMAARTAAWLVFATLAD